MYDIIIIGAGPAGLTAAIYARRALKKVLILESLNYGGQIINSLKIDNYPVNPGISGFEFATKLYSQVKDLDTEIKFEKAIKITDGKIKEVTTNKDTYKTKTIIIATGSNNRKLGLDNEDKYIGKGISYCATCDGAFYKEKDVAVIGGGNTALEDALYLSEIANKVYLIHRNDSFKAEETTVSKLKEKTNVEIIYNSNVTKINGDDKLTSIEINNKDIIEISGLFIAIGRIPLNEDFKDILMLENGYIKADSDCHTNISGIFAAGDNRVKKLRQLVTATADGAIAATEAIKYIDDNL